MAILNFIRNVSKNDLKELIYIYFFKESTSTVVLCLVMNKAIACLCKPRVEYQAEWKSMKYRKDETNILKTYYNEEEYARPWKLSMIITEDYIIKSEHSLPKTISY